MFSAVTTINLHYTAALTPAVAAIIGAADGDGVDAQARAYATVVGGPWEWRVRPSGAVAVVVPSGWQVIFQPHR